MSSTSEPPARPASDTTAAELLRHALDEARNLARLEISLARDKIAASKEPNWREYIEAWDAGAS